MKKTIFTFFVACNLAISGFFAVLATSPALAAECPLCDAAVINNIAEIRRLLDDGADPNQADANGITALMWAAYAGYSQIVKALLDGDADPNQANADGDTALMVAAGRGRTQIVKALLDSGANPNQADDNDSTALMVAASRGRTQIVKALLDGGANPNQAGDNDSTALIFAAIGGHTQIAKALLDGGANPNQTDAYDRTALIHAAFAGHSQTAKALLDGGANPNHVSAEGATALMSAMLSWQVDVVKILSDTSDSSWLFATCITDEMTDDKDCLATSHPIAFSATNSAAFSYLRRCATGHDTVAVVFNSPQFFDTNDLSTRSLSFLVRGDDKPAVKMQFSTSNLFLSHAVGFSDFAEAVALIRQSNNIRIRFPFRRGSKVIKFPMNGATAAIEKTREECKK